VESSFHSSSLKLSGDKNLSTSSPRSIIGIFSGGNFETAKSKELVSRHSDGL